MSANDWLVCVECPSLSVSQAHHLYYIQALNNAWYLAARISSRCTRLYGISSSHSQTAGAPSAPISTEPAAEPARPKAVVTWLAHLREECTTFQTSLLLGNIFSSDCFGRTEICLSPCTCLSPLLSRQSTETCTGEMKDRGRAGSRAPLLSLHLDHNDHSSMLRFHRSFCAFLPLSEDRAHERSFTMRFSRPLNKPLGSLCVPPTVCHQSLSKGPGWPDLTMWDLVAEPSANAADVFCAFSFRKRNSSCFIHLRWSWPNRSVSRQLLICKTCTPIFKGLGSNTAMNFPSFFKHYSRGTSRGTDKERDKKFYLS